MQLKGSTVLITGGTSGIGLEFVKQLTWQGAKVIVTGRNFDALNKTKLMYPAVHTFQSDVSSTRDIEQLYQQVTKLFPELNILINNAGYMRQMDLQDTTIDLEDITGEIDTNLSGTIHMVHRFLPHLTTRPSSAIINISSGIAFVPYSVAPIYSASKSGVHAYSQALRLQLSNTGVKVFEVLPPGVKTALHNDWLLQPAPHRLMDADKVVAIAIKGILKDEPEIRPGLTGIIKAMSRIVPGFALRLGHKEFEKYRDISKSGKV